MGSGSSSRGSRSVASQKPPKCDNCGTEGASYCLTGLIGRSSKATYRLWNKDRPDDQRWDLRWVEPGEGLASNFIRLCNVDCHIWRSCLSGYWPSWNRKSRLRKMSEAEPDEPREGPLCDCCHRVLIYDDGAVFHETYAAETDQVAMDELVSILARLPKT